ncbi:hypothetical protein ACFFGH_32635 [Lysobacter korlensis]|uniref:DUF1570 domain-containing protein n=1 Tax=Lysobacter korlensis TaxID=553636 RepID=A0ABV6S040_9GAMM
MTMLSRLKTMWAGDKPEPTPVRVQRPPVEMRWIADVSWPIPDWQAMAQAQQSDWTERTLDDYWTGGAYRWLEQMGRQWEPHLPVYESEHFLLLSGGSRRECEVTLAFCERSRRRILQFLPGIASRQGHGKHVLITFGDQDDYYDYVSNYYPSGEFAMSSGMFIDAGYGHFLTQEGLRYEEIEPVIAHELAHCLVRHLPLPAWLNEGIAVNTEHHFFPALAHPHAQQYFPHEMTAKHAAFWNRDTIQEFWSGKSFVRPDDGCMLSYDLAAKITKLAAGDFNAFRRFVLRAEGANAGAAAEGELGFPLRNLIEAVLGEGPWDPNPETWQEGIERGQFA